MGAMIMIMVDEMTKTELMKPIPYTGSDPFEMKIYEMRIAQYINNQQKLENEMHEALHSDLGSMHYLHGF